jgi:hypothetical protein
VAVNLPGPDRPVRVRIPKRPDRPKKLRPLKVRALKPPKKKTTPGNRYTSPPPPRFDPLSSPAVQSAARASLAPGAVGAPGAPGAAPVTANPLPGLNPYYGLPDWAQNQLRQIDADQKHHEQYVTGQVGPWLQGALTNLTGIDPSKPGINPTMQQQYLSNVQGVVGGALNAAASATPMNPASTMAGGLMGSPNAYLSSAAREGAAGRASGYLQAAQAQSALNTMMPNTQAQGYVYALADFAKGLPAVYAQQRSEKRVAIDQFRAEQEMAQAEMQFEQAKFAEDMRHNRVQEATSATNAQTNAAIALGRLGLDASDQAYDNQPDPTVGAPAPYGYVRDVDGSLKRDPSVPSASASGGAKKASTKGKYTPNQLKKEGFIAVPKGAGPAWTKNAVKATDGRYYIKKGSGGKAGGSTPKADTENLREKLDTFYFDKIDGKFEPEPAARRVANWILSRKGRFVKKNGQADAAAISRLLMEVIGGSIPPLVGQLIANHVGPNGRWR